MWQALAMPQASERWLATPIIRPRLPRMRPEISDILRPRTRIFRRRASYGIGWWAAQAHDDARSKRGSLRAFTRIVSFFASPFPHQFFELGIVFSWQDDASRCQKVAAAGLRRETFALKAEGATTAGSSRNRNFYRSIERWHADLGAENRLVERYRQINSYIGAIEGESGVRRY